MAQVDKALGYYNVFDGEITRKAGRWLIKFCGNFCLVILCAIHL